MKKVILSAIAVFVFGLANAQGVEFGVKGGLNVANVSGQENGKSLYGFSIGAFAEIKISPKFAIQPELLYSMQGTKYSTTTSSSGGGGFSFTSTDDVKAGLNYLNIPIMAKYFVIEKLSVQAGPQFGFLLAFDRTSNSSSSTTFAGVTKVSSTSSSSSDKSKLSSIDFGFNLGAGYDITEHFSADLRYNIGLTTINENSINGISDIKNNVFSLNLGYKF